METQGHQARELFYKDVEDTTNKIVERVKVLKQNQVDEEAAEKRAGQERAKSMQQEDGSYRLPVHEDSPEEDKKRADVFAGFPRELQYALLTQDVDDINAALQSMNKEDGSKYVQLASEIGMIQLQDDEDE